MGSFTLLSSQEQTVLHDALYFMKMAELKDACMMLEISESGKKGVLIERIMTFVTTGEIIGPLHIPEQSCTKNYPPQLLEPSGLMLYGSYKNDLKTRTFFKKFIGSHFHFTAYGIDWLEECWLRGEPPTYQEFATYWVQETERRLKQKVNPKDEWRFIKFVQEMSQLQPDISRTAIIRAWKLEQEKQHQIALLLLKRYKKRKSM